MEATGPAFEIARILAPHFAEVVVANAAEVRAISHAYRRTVSDWRAAGRPKQMSGAGAPTGRAS